jgi:AsmA protein
MRLIFSIFAAIVALVAAVFFLGPLFISTDAARAQLFAQVESATGYRLRVDGPVQFSLFPSLDLVAENVGVAQSDAPDTEFVTAKKLRFGLMWPALWGGKIQLTEVTLVDPVIAVPKMRARPQADAGASAAGSGESPVASMQRLSLDKLVIQNGTVILPPSGDAPGKRVEGITLEASLPAYDQPLTFDLQAVHDGNPVHVAGTATYRGDELALSQFTAKAFDAVLAGSATYKRNLLTLHPFTVKARGNALQGSLAADLSGQIPTVNVALTGDTLDLNALLSGSDGRGASAGGGAGGASGWSGLKIDFSGLRAANAKFKLTAGQIVYGNIKASPVSLEAMLSGGKLNAQLAEFKLSNGTGAAALAVDASRQVPAQRLTLSLTNFDAYPLLRDAAGFQNIEGTGTVALDLGASGASQRAMVQALNGTAKLNFADGAIRGINIPKAVRSLTTGTLSGWQETEVEKTDFASLGASFKIAAGQAKTDDLHLTGPLVRMTGTGTVDLPARTLQFRVDPRVVASLEGQGGEADLQGLGVPVIVAGPWASPRIHPDIKGILENPVAAYEQLNRLGGGLVNLPSVDQLGAGEAGGAVPAITNIIKDGTVDRDALQQGAIDGIGALLNRQAAEPASEAFVEPQAAAQAPAAPKPAPAPRPVAAPAPEQAAAPVQQEPMADPGEAEAWMSEEQAASADADGLNPAPQQRGAEETAGQILQNLLGN